MKNGTLYFMIYPDLRVTACSFNCNSKFQRECEKIGNTFKTRKEAEKVAEKIRQILMEFRKEDKPKI